MSIKKFNSFITDIGITSFIFSVLLCVVKLLGFFILDNLLNYTMGLFYFCAMIIFAQTKLAK